LKPALQRGPRSLARAIAALCQAPARATDTQSDGYTIAQLFDGVNQFTGKGAVKFGVNADKKEVSHRKFARAITKATTPSLE
jgi:hypothetical protein